MTTVTLLEWGDEKLEAEMPDLCGQPLKRCQYRQHVIFACENGVYAYDLDDEIWRAVDQRIDPQDLCPENYARWLP